MKPKRFSVADNVRAELARSNRQQAELAAALGVSPAGISRRLSGDTKFSAAEIAKAADFLQVPVTDLFGRPSEVSA